MTPFWHCATVFFEINGIVLRYGMIFGNIVRQRVTFGKLIL